MFDLFGGLFHLVPLGIPSPPGWTAYVDLLEEFLDYLAQLFHSGGLAVIAFTIIVKTILLPLTVKSTRSSRAMMEVQPMVKELQKKYGKDRQKLTEETMRLYHQHNVSPMAGCLPMLIQMPIFFGVYRAIAHLSEHASTEGGSQYWAQPFLWLPNLATADPYHILPILAGLLQFMQTRMARPRGQEKSTDPQQAMMNTMMTFMPITVVLFGWGFASGPVLYWVTQSAYSVLTQWLVTGWGGMLDWFPFLPDLPEHRRLGYKPKRSLEEIMVMSGENGEAKSSSGVSGWFNRKMMEAQQIQQQQQAAKNADKDNSGDESAQDEAVTAKPPPPKKKSSKGKSGTTAKTSDAGGSNAVVEQEVVVETNGTSRSSLPTPRKTKSGGGANS